MSGISIRQGCSGIAPSDSKKFDFAIIEEGSGSAANQDFRRFMMQALAANIGIGCLHVIGDSPESEAKSFSLAFKPFLGKAVPMFDSTATDAESVQIWLDAVESSIGARPLNVMETVSFGKAECTFDGERLDWDSLAALN